MPEPQTKPIFAKADGTLGATALNEPSLTLFESPHVMGFLVALGCQEDSFTGRLQLEDVVGQMLDVTRREVPVPGLGPRLSETAGPWKKLTQNPVMVAKEDAGWTARSSTGELIVSTGATPFVVLFLTPEDNQQLTAEMQENMAEAVIARIARQFSIFPLEVRSLLPLWSDLSRLFVPSMQPPTPTAQASARPGTIVNVSPPKAAITAVPFWLPGQPSRPGATVRISLPPKAKETIHVELPKASELPKTGNFATNLIQYLKSLLKRKPLDPGDTTQGGA